MHANAKKTKRPRYKDIMALCTANQRTRATEKQVAQIQIQKNTGGGEFKKVDII